MSVLEQHSRIDKFHQLWAMIPPHPGFARLNKPDCQVTQWSGKEVKALEHVRVPVFAVTHSNPSVRQRLSFTQALLCIKNLVYFDRMGWYWYQTGATMESMENYLEAFDCHQDVFTQFRVSKSTKQVTEALKVHVTLRKQEEWKSDVTWNNLSVEANRRRIDEAKTQILSKLYNILLTYPISTL